ncbi:hypothetical protein B5E92_12315, partial [Erysipelatoclostridium sp. An15]|uniref:AAA family ATPase n=1 Tax=Erysipelatoclostridium sp. An15 TaxID=1965566 RepID=UPI000B38FAE8
MKKIRLNITDFKTIIDNDYYYVDKSLLIKDVLNEKVVFYIRPKGFGKSLNMSMLYYFFSINESNNSYLFEQLKISQDKKAKLHQNKYPVIALSFKDLTANNFNDMIIGYQNILKTWLKNNIANYKKEATLYNLTTENISIIDLSNSLSTISQYLKDYYHQNVIILIDDYDTPLYFSSFNHYNDKAEQFINNLIKHTTNNKAIFKAIFTGRTTLKYEYCYIYNYQNNTIFTPSKNIYFGFNEEEIKNLLQAYQLISKLPDIKKYFGGYYFSNQLLYHPAWVMTYLRNPKNYEINVIENDFWINDLLTTKSFLIETELNKLLSNRTITKKVNQNISFSNLTFHNNIYIYFIFNGLLTLDGSVNNYLTIQHLKLPNLTTKMQCLNIYYHWYQNYIISKREKFLYALFNHETNTIQEIFIKIMNISFVPHVYNIEYYQGLLELLLGPLMQKSSSQPMWRRVIVPEKLTFNSLHLVIQKIFAFENCHLY